MDDPVPAQGYVNISFEIFDYKNKRTNILRESFPISDFLDLASSGIQPVLQRLKDATVKEILSPSEKKTML